MKVRQLSMFGDHSEHDVDTGGKKSCDGIWYFVQRRDPPHRVLYADSQGRFYYGERDLVRIVPVLFNTAREAKRVAQNQGGVVKRYPYKIR